MPRQTIEERLQHEIEKIDARVMKLETDRKDLMVERDKLEKALESLKG